MPRRARQMTGEIFVRPLGREREWDQLSEAGTLGDLDNRWCPDFETVQRVKAKTRARTRRTTSGSNRHRPASAARTEFTGRACPDAPVDRVLLHLGRDLRLHALFRRPGRGLP